MTNLKTNLKKWENNFCDNCNDYCEMVFKECEKIYDYKGEKIIVNQYYPTCENCGNEIYNEQFGNKLLEKLNQDIKTT